MANSKLDNKFHENCQQEQLKYEVLHAYHILLYIWTDNASTTNLHLKTMNKKNWLLFTDEKQQRQQQQQLEISLNTTLCFLAHHDWK